MDQTELTTFSSTLGAAQPLATALFRSAFVNGRVANAYLLVGRAADDKLILAKQLACFLNCQKVAELRGSCVATCRSSSSPAPDEALIGTWCLNCQWIWHESHPQAWLVLSGEGKSNKIPVEKARALTEELSKTSIFARVIVVPHSDEVTFHRPAANALLKCIEEPPANCLFLFFADSADDVLATIVSRCQVVPLTKALQLGYWRDPIAGQAPFSSDVVNRLETARSAFIMNARRSRASSLAAGGSVGVRVAGESADFSRQLQELCKELFEHMDEQQALEHALDLVVASELEVHRDDACRNAGCASYLSRVMDAAEKAKRQVNAYVRPANVIESFSLILSELRHGYSGDPNLAKR